MQGGPPHEHSLCRIVKGPITTPVVRATPQHICSDMDLINLTIFSFKVQTLKIRVI